MATIKSYTDLSQSKTLSKILPLESADMFIFFAGDKEIIRIHDRIEDYKNWEPVPVWSLAALLGVLPYCPDLSKHTDGNWYITTYPNDVHTCLMVYDNPVDACVKMIIKLHELNLL